MCLVWTMTACLRPLPIALGETASVWSSTPILLRTENRAPMRMCVCCTVHAMPCQLSDQYCVCCRAHLSQTFWLPLSCGHLLCCVSNATPTAAHRILPPQARAASHAVMFGCTLRTHHAIEPLALRLYTLSCLCDPLCCAKSEQGQHERARGLCACSSLLDLLACTFASTRWSTLPSN